MATAEKNLKLPVSAALGVSRLPMPSTLKRQRPTSSVLLQNPNDIENIEPLALKKVDFEDESAKPVVVVENKKKIVGVVKPAVNVSKIGLNLNSHANKLKRRSIGLLNRKSPLVKQTNYGHRLAPPIVARPVVAQRQRPQGSALASTRAPLKTNGGTAGGPRYAQPIARNSRSSSTRQSNSSLSSENTTSAKPPVPKARPGWDLKGRITDMEDAFKSQSYETLQLRTRVDNLQQEKAALQNTAVQSTAISQEAQKELGDARECLRTTRKELDDEIRKNANFQRENRELTGEIQTARLKMDEFSSSISKLSTAKLACELEHDSLKTAFKALQQNFNDVACNFEESTKKIKQLEEKLAEQNVKLQDGEMSRRRLHNTVQELRGNIRVFCRVRPFLRGEQKTEQNNQKLVHIIFPSDEKTSIEILKDKCGDFNETTSMTGGAKREVKHEFTFDRVFEPNSTQREVFEEISQLIQSAIDGYNVCIFAYGQTGSGKTYTMQGPEAEVFSNCPPEHEGMIPQSVRQIFEAADELKPRGWVYEFEASYLEIYNEKIRDLLTDQPNDDQNLEIKQIQAPIQKSTNAAHKPTSEITVVGLNVTKVHNDEQVHKLIEMAVEKRAKAATKCNERSSRSHAVFRLRIKGQNGVTGVQCDGTLTLVDLAGSERLKDSESTGERLKETQSINKSLSTLGQVILALAQKDAHVPYRNSKLTFLLQTYLGGNSKTLMFANISPTEESVSETINSLRFASKVNQCHIGAAFKK